MSSDDRLREAFEKSAPKVGDTSRVRGELGPAMTRARRRHRLRRGIAASALTLAVAGGGVAAAVQLVGGGDDEIDTRTSMLPTPDTMLSPSTTASPATTSLVVPTTPTTTLPIATTTTSAPTTAPSTTEAPTTTSTGPVTATLSGPHDTFCGSVTFRVTTQVTVESHVDTPGYTFSTEGEGSTEVEAKWEGAPEDECEVAAHLEDGELEIQFDRE